MRKLRLDLDALEVETFAADERNAEVGTVHGNMPFKIPATDDPGTDGGGSGPGTDWHTCDCTVRKTCQYTCGIDYCTESCATGPLVC